MTELHKILCMHVCMCVCASAHALLDLFLPIICWHTHSFSLTYSPWGSYPVPDKHSYSHWTSYIPGYGLNVCFPKIHILKTIPFIGWYLEVGDFGRWFGDKDKVLMSGISALIIGIPESFLALLPYEDMRTQWKDICLWTKKQALSRH